MNRAELTARVALETSLPKAAAERLIGTVFSAISDAIARDELVSIAGFGRFDARNRPARQGRNPRSGEPVAIPAT